MPGADFWYAQAGHPGGKAMAHYRLYFLHLDNRISRAIDVDCAGDEHAIEQASSFRYVHVIEVWQGTRLVKRIEPM
jgi:hypothetical protein